MRPRRALTALAQQVWRVTGVYGRGVVRLVVNGEERTVDASPGELLLSVLRERLGLTGAKSGCGEGVCGACTVLIDGKAAQACTVEALSIESAAVTTVEGLAAGGYLDALQSAFVTERAFQCGYCTAGMLMATHGLLLENPSPDEASIVQALNGNVLPVWRLSPHR
jgi:carbon-monoxide dehydrogenase small subunit